MFFFFNPWISIDPRTAQIHTNKCNIFGQRCDWERAVCEHEPDPNQSCVVVSSVWMNAYYSLKSENKYKKLK